jgi:hypothetical protein
MTRRRSSEVFQNRDHVPPIINDVFPELRSLMKRELEVFDRARSRFFLCAIQYRFLVR